MIGMRDYSCHEGGITRQTKRIWVMFVRYLPPQPSAVSEAREFVRAASTNLIGQVLNDLVLAASETCTNAVEHAGASRVKLTWDREPEGIVVQIEDDGVFGRETPGDHLGIGLSLVASVIDDITIRAGSEENPGTVVRLVKRTRSDEEEATAGQRRASGPSSIS